MRSLTEKRQEIETYKYYALTSLACLFSLIGLMLIVMLVVLNSNSLILSFVLGGVAGVLSIDLILLILKKFSTKD